MPRLSVTPLLALVAAMSACAPHVRLASPQTALPAQFETTGKAQDVVSLDRWWETFGDVQLTALVTTALDRSTDARTAYFRLVEARATRTVSRSQMLPTGDLSGSATVRDGNQVSGTDLTGQTLRSDSETLSVAPSWEIDLFGRLKAIGQAADATYRGAYYDYHATRMALAADAATSLFSARGLVVQRSDAAETLRIAKELATTSRLGLAHGLVAASDTARLESDEAAARAEVERIDTALRNAKRSLLVLTGDAQSPTDALVIEARLDAPPAVPDTLPSALLTRRPDILSAEQQLAAAAAAAQVDRLALFPRFSLQGSGSISRTTGPLGGIAGLWSIGGALALPILDRPRLMAQLRMSQARGEQAVVGYEAAVQAAFRDADNALATAATNRVRLDNLSRAEARARYAFEAARRGYRAGLTDLTTLLQSERSWRQARTILTSARAQALVDSVSLYRTLGGGWPASGVQTSGQPIPPLPSPTAG